MKTITIIISPQGDIRIEPTGFTGRTCLKATNDLEQALGATKERRFKPEYYRANTLHRPQGLEQSQ